MNKGSTTESELQEILSSSFGSETQIKNINYKGLFVPDVYPLVADSIENFEVREDDVWVCSFPKTGTTWTQEMVWCIAEDLDFEGAKIPLFKRFPFFEYSGSTVLGWLAFRYPEKGIPDSFTKSVDYVANFPSPRFIKTHLPFHLLPRQLRTGEKKCKIIYVARNPKDACISYYHHYKMVDNYCGSFENFVKLFLGEKVYYSPFWEHVIGYWQKKDESNILFLKYEDMKRDLPSAIKRTARHLGKSLDDDKVKILEKHLSFASMRENKATNYEDSPVPNLVHDLMKIEGKFMRKGTVGQWKTDMSEEMVKKFDDWTAKKLESHHDLRTEFM